MIFFTSCTLVNVWIKKQLSRWWEILWFEVLYTFNKRLNGAFTIQSRTGIGNQVITHLSKEREDHFTHLHFLFHCFGSLSVLKGRSNNLSNQWPTTKGVWKLRIQQRVRSVFSNCCRLRLKLHCGVGTQLQSRTDYTKHARTLPSSQMLR